MIITVGGDVAVDNGAVARLARRLALARCAPHAYEFPAGLHLNHDIIDPEQIGGNPALVYPVLLDLIAP